MVRPRAAQPGMREVIAIGAASAIVTTAVFTTYARFPATDFYHVSESGIRGGASRALVFLNFPLAFVALAVLPVALARLLPSASTRERWLVSATAALAAGLCLIATISVSQANLDAKPINALPALGVLLVAALTGLAIRRGGLGVTRPWRPLDTVLVAIGAVLLLLGIPWLLAEIGVYADDIPGLERIFMSKEIPAGETGVSVHLGEHHGFDGLFFALAAMALSRVVGSLRPRWLDLTFSWYVSFMFVYGIANMLQDFWGEQVVKRGWTTETIPTMYRPEIRPAWAVVALGMIVIWLILFYRPPGRRTSGRHTLVPSS